MKPQWTTYHNKFAEMIELYEQLRNGSTDKRMAKAFKKFTDFLNGVIGSHQEFSKLVEPVPPIDVKMPFDSERFAKEWKFYKEYLEEHHQIYMTSRLESINLRRLAGWALNNEEKAIYMLECHIAFRYTNLYPLSDNQLKGMESRPEEKASSSSLNLSSKKPII